MPTPRRDHHRQVDQETRGNHGISSKCHRCHILLCANLASSKTRLFATFQISPIWKNIFTNGLFSTNRTSMNTAFCEGFCLTLLQLGEPSNLRVKFFVDSHGKYYWDMLYLKYEVLTPTDGRSRVRTISVTKLTVFQPAPQWNSKGIPMWEANVRAEKLSTLSSTLF